MRFTFGINHTFDIPFTTNVKGIDGLDESTLKFVGTDKLGITEDLFKDIFTLWINHLVNKEYLAIKSFDSINYRSSDSDTYALEYSPKNKFVSKYRNLMAKPQRYS